MKTPNKTSLPTGNRSPISTPNTQRMIEYSDKSWLGRREYQLDPHKIRARGSQTSSGADFDMSVELRSLRPEYDKLWLRHPAFIPGLIAIMIGIPLLILFSTGPMSSSYPRLFGPAASGIVGIIIMVAFTSRKTHGVQFKTNTGVPALLILQAGPRKNEFMQFVTAVQEAIIRAEQGADGKQPESEQPPHQLNPNTRLP